MTNRRARALTRTVPAAARTRRATRVLATAAALAMGVLAAGAAPASAAGTTSDHAAWGITPVGAVLLFLGFPLLVFAIVTTLVYSTSRNSEPRLREGQAWWAEPDFNTREGVASDGGAAAPRTTDGGGTSAGW